MGTGWRSTVHSMKPWLMSNLWQLTNQNLQSPQNDDPLSKAKRIWASLLGIVKVQVLSGIYAPVWQLPPAGGDQDQRSCPVSDVADGTRVL